MRTLIILLAGAILLTACTRPKEVTNVASNMHPVVTGLHRSADSAASRYTVQRQTVERRRRDLELQSADAARLTQRTTRAWGDAGEKAKLERLERMRLDDAMLRADPLAGLEPAGLTLTEAGPVDTKGLEAALKSLARLKSGEATLSMSELLTFAQQVCAEQAKLAKEQGREPAEFCPSGD